LLLALKDVPDAERAARFRCAMVFIDEDGSEIVANGACEGRIEHEPKGEKGFGYDPLFQPDSTPGRRMASSRPPRRTRSATAAPRCATCGRSSSTGRFARDAGCRGALSLHTKVHTSWQAGGWVSESTWLVEAEIMDAWCASR